MYIDVFYEQPCLSESSYLSGMSLQKKWFKGTDKRILGLYLQKLLEINRDALDFLGVRCETIGSDQNTSLLLTSSHYIGAVPLRSPENGKQMGDLVITPRFGVGDKYEQYSEILYLLDEYIEPIFFDGLPLVSGRNFRPPFYLEAMKFLLALKDLTENDWRKFTCEEQKNSTPIGHVNWNKYTQTSYKIEQQLNFPVRKNLLSEFHAEYSQIKYIFEICKRELNSSNTPLKIKLSVKNLITYLEEKLYFHDPKKISAIEYHFSDPPYVVRSKEQANKILKNNFIESLGWRVDYSLVFEKYIQYIFGIVANEIGANFSRNPRLPSSNSPYFNWNLSYLEPDAMIQVGSDTTIFIDAKYKSHLFNKNVSGDSYLRDDHRHDLHQILAYSAFSKSGLKYCFLCYPSNSVELSSINYHNPYSEDVTIKIFLLGVPTEIDSIQQAKSRILEVFDSIQGSK